MPCLLVKEKQQEQIGVPSLEEERLQKNFFLHAKTAKPIEMVMTKTNPDNCDLFVILSYDGIFIFFL